MTRRPKIKRTVKVKRRIYRTVTVTKTVLQCERPYVLFGRAVKAVRMTRCWTQQELADRLRLSRGSIANIETGRQRVLLSDVFDFAKVLGVLPLKLFREVSR